MGYKIVVDSCCDLPDYLRNKTYIESVPLTLEVGEEQIIDDETFDQLVFLKKVAQCPTAAKSACPSPEAFKLAYEGEADAVYVVTLSDQVSGSYNSAVLGMNLYYEEHGRDKQIHVFNSCSASCGQAQLVCKIKELAEKGMEFTKLVAEVEDFRYAMNTYFVLETLETLRKNGRLTHMQAAISGVLNIKPVMGVTKDGVICKIGQSRGMERALLKLVDVVMEQVVDAEKKILMISECNCRERAEWLKQKFLKHGRFREVRIVKMGGVSTLYANDGGIIVAV
jgi:DegV family protein with EDD domain